ncbi:putative cytochrome c oxidase assembly protein Cox19 [Wallemia mellicola CBS 633.66]|uniref:Cytochrome c oxidase assembly protein COX19 n=1 Tax=Wallemia mellicola (strain ATCC MYA-4683 / CBS 633.66) TaxID=671144 RepID=I4YGW9_WALMC|nr:putative cytochrome c oxidase assembly protein Cox19 [Wallemia mellicola CBS 633.66]EIM23211.1 putative cytochrome c oxidase assembly protein Cox19 [Wallemia mellicola CBS 633.66]|eukprot:XP_006956603.1 putative cytochrome c oxidase assembly protein Cox19 [Wallemia mellicola CBS 633.66]
MGFGNPSTSNNIFSITPPARGSFPLDHDGDCTKPMKEYLKCLKSNRNNNGACRELSKSYLKCRMQNGLMENDNFDNLGFTGVSDPTENKTQSKSTHTSTERLV